MENHSVLSIFYSLFSPVLLAANTQANLLLAFIIVVLLIISFFISGAQLAFFSLNNRDINLLKTKQDKGWKRIAYLLEEPKILLVALMIANTLVNISVIIVSNVMIDQIIILQDYYWWAELLIKVVAISAMIILFGEILPRVRATHNNLRFAYEASYLVEIIYYVFSRLASFLINLSDNIEKFFGGKTSRINAQAELERAIRSTVKEEGERKILGGIYSFSDITVKQVMRTRLDVSGIEHNTNFAGLKNRVNELHYSRLPVYRNNLDDIVGIIHTRDILVYLNEADDFDWHSLIRAPYFVHEHKYIRDLLEEFREKRFHFAVVVDEFGGTNGIVTMEDIIEEIVGDIEDEYDTEETGNKKIDDKTYIFEGRTMINDMCKMMDISVDTFNAVRGDSDSLAGLILELAGRIPEANDIVLAGDFEFTILAVQKTRIQTVQVSIKTQS